MMAIGRVKFDAVEAAAAVAVGKPLSLMNPARVPVAATSTLTVVTAADDA
jgi:hypothetical protein